MNRLVGALLAVFAANYSHGQEMAEGYWVFYDVSKGEKFALDIDFRRSTTSTDVRIYGEYYGSRRLPYPDLHNKTLKIKLWPGGEVRISLKDIVLMKGTLNETGDALQGEFTDGSKFVAGRNYRSPFDKQPQEYIHQLCYDEFDQKEWRCMGTGAFSMFSGMQTIGCEKRPVPTKIGPSTFYSKEECESSYSDIKKSGP